MIIRLNWALFIGSSLLALAAAPRVFAFGVFAGGLIVTLNFHMLGRTLKKALTPPHLSSHNVVLVKYYIRFIISGVLIFLLISNRLVDPIGLFLGLSVVVASITLATMVEFKNLFSKEAV